MKKGDTEWMSEVFIGEGEWSGSAQTWAEYALVRLMDGLSPEMDGGWRVALRYLFAASDTVAANSYTYLCLRFGPPSTGYDKEKEMGQWVLSTPDATVAVVVRPKASMVGVSVIRPEYLYSEDGQGAPQVKVAVLATLRDMLRPVRIRDQWRNIAGMWKPGSDDVDQDTGELANGATLFAHAGRGVSPSYWARKDVPA